MFFVRRPMFSHFQGWKQMVHLMVSFLRTFQLYNPFFVKLHSKSFEPVDVRTSNHVNLEDSSPASHGISM
jgi:hypothetical protein